MARVLYSGVDEHGQPSEVMLGCAIGDIIPHFGTTAPPGTLVCDGSEVSREAYAELYQEIGSLVGQGDGSTTFNLPDLRGKWLMGADAERAAGEEIAEGLPNISGFVPSTNIITGSRRWESHELSEDNTWSERGGAITTYFAKRTPPATTSGDPVDQIFSIDFDASRSSAIYGAQNHVTPASVAVLPCIVYE